MENVTYPSWKNMHCPYCNGASYKIISTKGAMGKVAGAVAFGAIGNLVQSAGAKNNFEFQPANCQCMNCNKKFEAFPNAAEPDDILDVPCTVVLRRLSSFVGMGVVQQVYLNGVKVGVVKNNSELRFETYTKHNVIFVTDHSGLAFPGHYTFIAQNGGVETINFKRKFV